MPRIFQLVNNVGLTPLLTFLNPPLGVEMAASEGGGGDQQEYERQPGFHGWIISF